MQGAQTLNPHGTQRPSAKCLSLNMYPSRSSLFRSVIGEQKPNLQTLHPKPSTLRVTPGTVGVLNFE